MPLFKKKDPAASAPLTTFEPSEELLKDFQIYTESIAARRSVLAFFAKRDRRRTIREGCYIAVMLFSVFVGTVAVSQQKAFVYTTERVAGIPTWEPAKPICTAGQGSIVDVGREYVEMVNERWVDPNARIKNYNFAMLRTDTKIRPVIEKLLKEEPAPEKPNGPGWTRLLKGWGRPDIIAMPTDKSPTATVHYTWTAESSYDYQLKATRYMQATVALRLAPDSPEELVNGPHDCLHVYDYTQNVVGQPDEAAPKLSQNTPRN